MQQEIKIISPQAAWEQSRQGDSCQIIDVREPDEYAAVCVAGSTLLPLSSLDPQNVSLDQSKNIFLLCGKGRRASKAAELLSGAGVQNLFVIDGGLEAWHAAGCPVETR